MTGPDARVNDPRSVRLKVTEVESEHAQGEHAGSAHAPEAFDSKSPDKQGVGTKEQGSERKKPAPDGEVGTAELRDRWGRSRRRRPCAVSRWKTRRW